MASSFESLLCSEDNNSIFDDSDFGAVEEFEALWNHRNDRESDDQNQSFDDAPIGLPPLRSDESLAVMVQKEGQHLPGIDYLKRLQSADLALGARKEAIDWIGEVHAHFGFGPLCTYLSINYLDRFLAVYEMPWYQSHFLGNLMEEIFSLSATNMELQDINKSLVGVKVQMDEAIDKLKALLSRFPDPPCKSSLALPSPLIFATCLGEDQVTESEVVSVVSEFDDVVSTEELDEIDKMSKRVLVECQMLTWEGDFYEAHKVLDEMSMSRTIDYLKVCSEPLLQFSVPSKVVLEMVKWPTGIGTKQVIKFRKEDYRWVLGLIIDENVLETTWGLMSSVGMGSSVYTQFLIEIVGWLFTAILLEMGNYFSTTSFGSSLILGDVDHGSKMGGSLEISHACCSNLEMSKSTEIHTRTLISPQAIFDRCLHVKFFYYSRDFSSKHLVWRCDPSSQAGSENSTDGSNVNDESISESKLLDEGAITEGSYLKLFNDGDVMEGPCTNELEFLVHETNTCDKMCGEKDHSQMIKVIFVDWYVSTNNVLDKLMAKWKELAQKDISFTVIDIRQRRMYVRPLHFSEWADTNKVFDLVERDYAYCLDLNAKIHGLYKAGNYIHNVPESVSVEFLYRTLLANRVVLNNAAKVSKTVKDLGYPFSAFACNHMLLFYICLQRVVLRLTLHSKGRPIFDEMCKVEGEATNSPTNQSQFNHPPTRIGVAPSIKNDYYTNIMDWGKQNVLVVALGSDFCLWNANVHYLFRAEGENDYPTSIAWSDDTILVAVGFMCSIIQLWDLEASKLLRNQEGRTKRIEIVAWNGKVLASGSEDKSILNQDVQAQNSWTMRVQPHSREVYGLKWSSTENALANGGSDNLIRMWETFKVNTPNLLFSFHEHCDTVKALVWCQYQSHIVSGGGTRDGYIHVWDIQKGTSIQSFDAKAQVCESEWNINHKYILLGHGFSMNHLSQNQDDDLTVASAGVEVTIHFWDIIGLSDCYVVNSLFGTVATLSSSSADIGLSSFASSSNDNTVSSSGSVTSSSLFGFSWQHLPTKSLIFPSLDIISSLSGISFGAFTASVAATSSGLVLQGYVVFQILLDLGVDMDDRTVIDVALGWSVALGSLLFEICGIILGSCKPLEADGKIWRLPCGVLSSKEFVQGWFDLGLIRGIIISNITRNPLLKFIVHYVLKQEGNETICGYDLFFIKDIDSVIEGVFPDCMVIQKLLTFDGLSLLEVIDELRSYVSMRVDEITNKELVHKVLIYVDLFYVFHMLNQILGDKNHLKERVMLRVNYDIGYPQKGKSWMGQLLAVACLSLSAKLEETEVPSALDLQVGQSKYVFEAKTIQRMELLVLGTLKWRLHAVTPFSFIDSFMHKINGGSVPIRTSALQRANQLILGTIKAIDFLEFKPSEIAAAVAISVAGEETETIDADKKVSALAQLVDKAKVVKCIELIQDLELGSEYRFGSSSVFSAPQSPVGVLDAACFSYKSDDSTVRSRNNGSHNSPQPKRRRLTFE